MHFMYRSVNGPLCSKIQAFFLCLVIREAEELLYPFFIPYPFCFSETKQKYD